MFGAIQQSVSDEDKVGRKLLAEYLIQSLNEYSKYDCVAPEIGVPFPEINEDGNTQHEHRPLMLKKVGEENKLR